MRSALGGLLVIAVLAGCGNSTAPSTDLRYAAWGMGCGPADGPITLITLSSNSDAAHPAIPFVNADSVMHGEFTLFFPARAVVGEFWAGRVHQVLLCG